MPAIFLHNAALQVEEMNFTFVARLSNKNPDTSGQVCQALQFMAPHACRNSHMLLSYGGADILNATCSVLSFKNVVQLHVIMPSTPPLSFACKCCCMSIWTGHHHNHAIFQRLSRPGVTTNLHYAVQRTDDLSLPNEGGLDEVDYYKNTIYNIFLMPPVKTEALTYLDNGGPLPGRFARAIVIRGAQPMPDTMEYQARETVANIFSFVSSTLMTLSVLLHIQ